MAANRRRRYNFALQHAAHWAAELRQPLVVVEAMGSDYAWASDRSHAFLLQGAQSNRNAFKDSAALYLADAATEQSEAGVGALVRDASRVVVDDYPAFEASAWAASIGRWSPVLVEAVDSCGLFPFRATDRSFISAYNFRRFLQKRLREDLDCLPQKDPLDGLDLPRLSGEARSRLLAGALTGDEPLSRFRLDHSVSPVSNLEGGETAAQRRLREFLDDGLEDYAEGRNDIESGNSTRLSPYLHFGHMSVHEILDALIHRERWTPARLGKADGSRTGWWGMRPGAEALLDQVVTWRELGFNCCATNPAFNQFSSLPEWSRQTLTKHAADRRERLYDLEGFEAAGTHDALWNAAQCELVLEGRIHNYLRMLWGKKILEWSAGPEEALAVMIQLNNKYALDGNDPNSYSGIFWTLGRYDRPWGPERPVFGSVRYMSSENTARKLDVRPYLRRFGKEGVA